MKPRMIFLLPSLSSTCCPSRRSARPRISLSNAWCSSPAVSAFSSARVRYQTMPPSNCRSGPSRSMTCSNRWSSRIWWRQDRTIVFGSLDPIERALKSFAIDLTDNPPLSELLNRMRGVEAEITAPKEIQGVIVGVESHQQKIKDEVIQCPC